jgi:hypothetical protein
MKLPPLGMEARRLILGVEADEVRARYSGAALAAVLFITPGGGRPGSERVWQ